MIGTTGWRVTEFLKRRGVFRKRLSALERNKELAMKMANSGCSISEIARTVRTSNRHVRPFLEKNGIFREYLTYKVGCKNWNWKGGRHIDRDGYVLINMRGHPTARKNGNMFEHRLVMEKHLGRYLRRGEVVHHINGIHCDNRIENLKLFGCNGDHLRHELKGKCPNWSEPARARLLEVCRRNADLKRGKKIHLRPKLDVPQ